MTTVTTGDGIRIFYKDWGPRSITVPTLVLHGDDDQIVPVGASAPLSAKLLQSSTLNIYETFPHGMCATHADVINPELLAFIKA